VILTINDSIILWYFHLKVSNVTFWYLLLLSPLFLLSSLHRGGICNIKGTYIKLPIMIASSFGKDGSFYLLKPPSKPSHLLLNFNDGFISSHLMCLVKRDSNWGGWITITGHALGEQWVDVEKGLEKSHKNAREEHGSCYSTWVNRVACCWSTVEFYPKHMLCLVFCNAIWSSYTLSSMVF